jgi:predicted nucleic acid-binding protein
LWRCPYEIIKLIERGDIEGHTSLTNIFEIRFVLRRKKRYGEEKIRECIESLFGAIEIDVVDSGDMLEANRLQSEQQLDPFDSIGLSIILVNSAILMSIVLSLHVVTMHKYGITNIATNDPDFERVDWLTVWKP